MQIHRIIYALVAVGKSVIENCIFQFTKLTLIGSTHAHAVGTYLKSASAQPCISVVSEFNTSIAAREIF